MRRRRILAGLLLSLAAPLAAEAQQAAKVARIGYLAANLAASPHLREAFLQGLRDLGYVEGRNVVIEYRDAEGKLERLPALAAELVALKVDVIVAASTLAALAAKQATRTLPIVFAAAADPVASGLVTSLARPGGNVTGLSILAPELVGKCLEQLKQAVPGVSRVAVLWQPGALGERTEKDMLKGAEVAARALGVRLQFVEARGPADFDRAFSDMTRARAGALTVLPSAMFVNERRRLVDLAAKNRLPAVYALREFVDAGGLMSYGPNLADLFRRAATYVDKILKGAKPGDLPVEQPTKFELVINLKTAKALGLTIPPSVLRAGGSGDRVMDRRAFLGTIAGGLLAAPLAAEAQPAAKTSRIGYLSPTSASDQITAGASGRFREGLRDLGYVEGQNITIESRWAEGEYGRLPDLAAELVHLKVDVIVTYAPPAIQAAKHATGTIPIVMAGIIDPVATGFVASLARPGGNITGLSLMAPELVGKQLEILKQAIPKVTRVAVLGNPANAGTSPQLRHAQEAARALKVRLQLLEARGPNDLDSAFAKMTKEGADAVVVLVDAMLIDQRTRVARPRGKASPAIYLRAH